MKLIKMFDMTDMNNECAVYEREFGSKTEKKIILSKIGYLTWKEWH